MAKSKKQMPKNKRMMQNMSSEDDGEDMPMRNRPKSKTKVKGKVKQQ